MKKCHRDRQLDKSHLAQLAQPPLVFAMMAKVVSPSTDDQGASHASAEVLAVSRHLIVPVPANAKASQA